MFLLIYHFVYVLTFSCVCFYLLFVCLCFFVVCFFGGCAFDILKPQQLISSCSRQTRTQSCGYETSNHKFCWSFCWYTLFCHNCPCGLIFICVIVCWRARDCCTPCKHASMGPHAFEMKWHDHTYTSQFWWEDRASLVSDRLLLLSVF